MILYVYFKLNSVLTIFPFIDIKTLLEIESLICMRVSLIDLFSHIHSLYVSHTASAICLDFTFFRVFSLNYLIVHAGQAHPRHPPLLQHGEPRLEGAPSRTPARIFQVPYDNSDIDF